MGTAVDRDVRRHELLLLLSSLLPDDVVWQARAWLAADRWSSAVRAVLDVFREWGEPLPAGAADILADGTDGRVAARIGEVGEAPDQPVPVWRFRPPDEVDPGLAAEAAQLVRDQLRDVPGTQTAWQVGRFPELTGPGRLVHLVEVEDGPEPHDLAARLADRLWHAGLVSPQVEVFRPENALDPHYHAPALSTATEIHADGPAPVIELALFDPAEQRREPDGPQRQAQLAYLRSGEPLTEDDEWAPDLFTEDDEPVVPLTLRTDGRWVWSDATAHYLEVHGVALPEGLRAHIAESGDRARMPTRREWVAMVHLEREQGEPLTMETEP